MKPSAKTRPPVGQRLLTAAKTGSIAAGGSLLGLSVALAVGRWLDPSSAAVPAWMALTVGSVILAVVRPGALRDAGDFLERVLVAVVFGFALALSVFCPIVAWLRLPHDCLEAIALYNLAGVVMLFFGLHRRTAPRVSGGFEGELGGLLPASPPAPEGAPGLVYGLAVNGPAITATESERDGLAVEVRVRWGADLLRVVHLDPPRAFTLGDVGSDVVVDCEALGAPCLRLIALGAAGPVVVAPPGARAMVQVGARHLTLAQALTDGLAEPSGDAATIALALGTVVSIALPSGAAVAGYRAPHGDVDAASARVVLEVSLVRPGRVVGRGLSLGGAGPAVASTMVVAGVVLGGLGGLAASAPPPDVDDGPSPDQMVQMQRYLQAFAEKEMEEQEADQLARAADGDDGVHLMNPDTRGTRRPGYVAAWFADVRTWGAEMVGDEHPFDQPAGADSFGLLPFCGLADFGLGSADLHPQFPDALERYCDTSIVTPFGLRTLGTPLQRDLLGRDPGDPWPFDLARATALLSAPLQPLASGAVVRVRTDPPPPLGSGALDRVMRDRQRDLDTCYALGLASKPALTGGLDLRVTLGVDGAVRTRILEGKRTLDPVVKRCLQGAISGPTRVRPARVESGTYRLDLRREAATSRR